MHKDTVFGEVNLRKIKTVPLHIACKVPKSIVEEDLKSKILELIDKGFDSKTIKKYFEDNKYVWSDVNTSKIKIYYFTKDTNDRFFATRKFLDSSFDKGKIECITDTGIQKILYEHLKNNEYNSDSAFSPEGIEEMNRNIISLNNGKFHAPIFKVRVYEKADKFAIGDKVEQKRSKFVEAAKGTNLFFAVYQKKLYNGSEEKIEFSRTYSTIPLNVVISRYKQGLSPAPEIDENGNKLLFVLSPNSLVYLPTSSQLYRQLSVGDIIKDRIYKMVSCTGKQCFFIPANIANVIVDTIELGSNNKSEKAWTGETIKEFCLPIKINRIGEIVEI